MMNLRSAPEFTARKQERHWPGASTSITIHCRHSFSLNDSNPMNKETKNAGYRWESYRCHGSRLLVVRTTLAVSRRDSLQTYMNLSSKGTPLQRRNFGKSTKLKAERPVVSRLSQFEGGIDQSGTGHSSSTPLLHQHTTRG